MGPPSRTTGSRGKREKERVIISGGEEENKSGETRVGRPDLWRGDLYSPLKGGEKVERESGEM